MFQLYHVENKLHMMRWWWGPLCTNTLSWIFLMLAPWNNSSWVEM